MEDREGLQEEPGVWTSLIRQLESSNTWLSSFIGKTDEMDFLNWKPLVELPLISSQKGDDEDFRKDVVSKAEVCRRDAKGCGVTPLSETDVLGVPPVARILFLGRKVP